MRFQYAFSAKADAKIDYKRILYYKNCIKNQRRQQRKAYSAVKKNERWQSLKPYAAVKMCARWKIYKPYTAHCKKLETKFGKT